MKNSQNSGYPHSKNNHNPEVYNKLNTRREVSRVKIEKIINNGFQKKISIQNPELGFKKSGEIIDLSPLGIQVKLPNRGLKEGNSISLSFSLGNDNYYLKGIIINMRPTEDGLSSYLGIKFNSRNKDIDKLMSSINIKGN